MSKRQRRETNKKDDIPNTFQCKLYIRGTQYKYIDYKDKQWKVNESIGSTVSFE